MPYNLKAYSPALEFFQTADDNIVDPWDLKRVQAYDFYENIYLNSTVNLKIILQGEDQTPILMPNGKKVVEATHRFLAKNLDYLVDAGGDEGAQISADDWWADFYKREALRAKFESCKRWGLIRGDGAFYVYAKSEKTGGKRICIEEFDPRGLFEIEEDPNDPKACSGYHLVERVQDWREADKPDKQVAKRRTFRKVYDETGAVVGVTSETTFWEIGKWDDRSVKAKADQEKVIEGAEEHGATEEFELGSESVPITNLPIYKWRTRPLQNCSWGQSILTGLETLLYAINQTLSDEDQTIVFQGLGMYATTSGRPRDEDGNPGPWNIGPKQVIELSENQTFERVTGVDSVQPMQDHMKFIDEKGISEASGTPEVAIGRVDVAVAESGISLQLQLAPLLASNSELELEIITVLDQMHYDITTQWLPAYEGEMFGDTEKMSQITVVTIFDDPMPKDRKAKVDELVLLDTSGLLLKSMIVGELRDIGYRWPTTGPNGEALTDEDIAAMLIDQSATLAAASDPFAAAGGGNPADQQFPEDQQSNTPSDQTIDLGNT